MQTLLATGVERNYVSGVQTLLAAGVEGTREQTLLAAGVERNYVSCVQTLSATGVEGNCVFRECIHMLRCHRRFAGDA